MTIQPEELERIATPMDREQGREAAASTRRDDRDGRPDPRADRNHLPGNEQDLGHRSRPRPRTATGAGNVGRNCARTRPASRARATTGPRAWPMPGSPAGVAGSGPGDHRGPLLVLPVQRLRLRLRLRGRRPLNDPVTASPPVSTEVAMSARIWYSVGC
jgi:hypothetical protein